jgi:hypothetical protein
VGVVTALTTEQALAAAQDPRVVALVMAKWVHYRHGDRVVFGELRTDLPALQTLLQGDDPWSLWCRVSSRGEPTEEQARALLDAVREHDGYAGDAEDWPAMSEALDRLDAALDAIVGAS